MVHESRLVKLYFRVDLEPSGRAYRERLARLLLEWQLGLRVQAFEVKEDSRLEVNFYADIDSSEYQDAFVDYHFNHGWNVDEIALLGLLSPDSGVDKLASANISWGERQGDFADENEARIFWLRPGRGEQQKSLDCWMVKYDGSPTNRDGTPSAVEEADEERLLYRKGVLFCGPFSSGLHGKFVRLAFKWEHYLRERGIGFRRLDNFSDFEDQ